MLLHPKQLYWQKTIVYQNRDARKVEINFRGTNMKFYNVQVKTENYYDFVAKFLHCELTRRWFDLYTDKRFWQNSVV